jgi:hypothetical protein
MKRIWDNTKYFWSKSKKTIILFTFLIWAKYSAPKLESDPYALINLPINFIEVFLTVWLFKFSQSKLKFPNDTWYAIGIISFGLLLLYVNISPWFISIPLFIISVILVMLFFKKLWHKSPSENNNTCVKNITNKIYHNIISYRKKILYCFIVLFILLIITNPSPSDFKAFEASEYLGINKDNPCGRKFNAIILSVYIVEYEQDCENGTEVKHKKYIGIFKNFFEI